jgi:hypothetical protein
MNAPFLSLHRSDLTSLPSSGIKRYDKLACLTSFQQLFSIKKRVSIDRVVLSQT